MVAEAGRVRPLRTTSVMVAAPRFVHLQSVHHDCVALTVYYFIFLRRKTDADFRVLASAWNSTTLDTRFRYRPSDFTLPIPASSSWISTSARKKCSARWPFSRAYFAKMLDVLREDGAKVAAFDITFSKPDQTAAPIRALAEELEKREQARRSHRSQVDGRSPSTRRRNMTRMLSSQKPSSDLVL